MKYYFLAVHESVVKCRDWLLLGRMNKLNFELHLILNELNAIDGD